MPPTEPLFRADAYAKECSASIVGLSDKGVVLDRTILYAQGGGQPGDKGVIVHAGVDIPVANTIYGEDRAGIVHLVEAGHPLSPGDQVTVKLDWAARYPRMRIHTALHLLSVALPFPVTGGSIGEGEGRLDFDIPEAGLDKDEIADKVNAMIATDAAVTERWITDDELLANPGLVKTMTVKPPMGSGRVRLIAIEGLDLQPCGGTHVRSTGEIGRIAVTAIEKKGKQNRRVRISLVQ